MPFTPEEEEHAWELVEGDYRQRGLQLPTQERLDLQEFLVDYLLCAQEGQGLLRAFHGGTATLEHKAALKSLFDYLINDYLTAELAP